MKVKGRLCGKPVILKFENDEPLFKDQKLQIVRDLLGDQFEYEDVSEEEIDAEEASTAALKASSEESKENYYASLDRWIEGNHTRAIEAIEEEAKLRDSLIAHPDKLLLDLYHTFEFKNSLLREEVDIERSNTTTNLNLKCSYLYDHIEHLSNQLARTTARVHALETLLVSLFPETISKIKTLRDTLKV